jgi:threonylcarbamoyladenosine tRNA methylthiotransferase MtaB
VTLEVVSLGCRLNLSESESLRGLLAAADNLTVVNSCAVTAEAVRQTRQAIRRARRARPDARLLVTGCAAEVERQMLTAMPEVDGLVSNIRKLAPDAYLHPREGGDLMPHEAAVEHYRLRPPPPRGRNTPSAHSRAFVDVQTGCDHACTFCVIPQGRGPSRSRPIAAVLEDVASHLDGGAREVVLTGVDLTSWGQDLPGGPRLGALAEAILAAFPRLARLRMSSLDGIEIDDALFELLAGEGRVMPHVHLSLQSGDDMVLKRMKRRHSRADAVRLVERLRARRPHIAVGADLIAGFPTEDDAMHAANLSIIAELGVVHGHIFPYSPRPGTPAARMPQVAAATIKARAGELRDAVAKERRAWLQSLIGSPLQVLTERDGTGHAENFAHVRLPGGAAAAQIMTIRPTQIVEGMLA